MPVQTQVLNLFYLANRINLSLDSFVSRQAARPSPSFNFAMSWDPCTSVLRITMNFGDTLSVLEEDTGNVPKHARTHTQHSGLTCLVKKGK